jgi:hypothetical protein
MILERKIWAKCWIKQSDFGEANGKGKGKGKDNVKVNFALQHSMKAQRQSRGVNLLFPVTSASEGVGGQRHSPSPLPPGKKKPVPIAQKAYSCASVAAIHSFFPTGKLSLCSTAFRMSELLLSTVLTL